MIEAVRIKNFKSVVDLSLELGSFNVLIGENGCGKSNILEAIAFAGAASADKLDYEFLGSRGIRVANPEFMYSAFTNGKTEKRIEIEFKLKDGQFQNIKYIIKNVSGSIKKWKNIAKDLLNKSLGNEMAKLLFKKDKSERKQELEKIFASDRSLVKVLESFADQLTTKAKKDGKGSKEIIKVFKIIFNQFLDDRFSNETISDYIIYSPEQSSLRMFSETAQIYPLGIKGEGVFQYLKEMTFDKKNKKALNDIKENLTLLDWFENFSLPDDLLKNEFTLKIRDKYLSSSLKHFDQRSTNEGFLFLLFYSTLFISKATPAFFAIDNIDASLNPKLCMHLTKNLAALAKKNKKQVIVTTQNPAILDGLNLKNGDQRLFVISRDSKGQTRAERINYNKKRTMRLSEIWTKGFIGGLPENF